MCAGARTKGLIFRDNWDDWDEWDDWGTMMGNGLGGKKRLEIGMVLWQNYLRFRISI